MTRCIALLRAVNVSGTKAVAMPALCKLLTSLGLDDVRSVLQSGNVVFSSNDKADAALEAKLEAALAKSMGVQTEFFVRSAREWAAIIAKNPYLDAARDDPARLVLMTLKSAPASKDVAALRAAIAGPETLTVTGKHAYIIYPEGQGESKLTNALIQRKLNTTGTARNWNTVLKLATLVS